VVVQLQRPRLEPLPHTDKASVVELLAELLLDAARDAASALSAGPALIEAEQEEA
jgi:hypothetical protein